MIVTTKSTADRSTIETIVNRVEDFGLQTFVSYGASKNVICVIGDYQKIPASIFADLSDIEEIKLSSKPYKLISREPQSPSTVVKVKGIPFGGNEIQIVAGPCSVETPEQMEASAAAVSDAGALFLRGGAFKPRTSPYSFQGHGEKGLKYLTDAAQKYDLPVVTELMDVRDLDTFLKYGVDVIQIGARNMQNFSLLKEVGRVDVPVILKRGMSATIKDWLMAAEYIAAGGNQNIILAERGIRTYENAYRNLLDISAIPFVKKETHLPVIVDPSHAGGQSWMVPALSLASIAAGADGLLIEAHPTPASAWSDGEQSLTPQELKKLVSQIEVVAQSVGRKLDQRNYSSRSYLAEELAVSLAA